MSSIKSFIILFVSSTTLLGLASPRILFSAGLTVGDTLLKSPLSAEGAALGGAKIFDRRSMGNPSYTAVAFSTATADISFGYSSTALGVKSFEVGAVVANNGGFVAGLNFTRQDAGDADIHRLPFETAVEELIFTRNLQTDNLLSIGAGYRFSENFSVGGALRYLNSRILDEYELSSFSFDAGLTLPFKFIGRKMVLSALASNMGNGGNYSGTGSSSEKFPLPLVYSGGISYSLFKFADIMFFGDYLAPPEGKNSYGASAEFNFPDDKVYPLNSVRLRFGWRMPFSGQPSSGAIGNAAMGFSVGFSEYLLDYAFVPLDDAGFTHRVGLTYRFSHKAVIPKQNIIETSRIIFTDGKFEEKSFVKLEDIAQTLKEKTSYIVRVEGDLENVDKVMDYFVNNERLPESLFTTMEKDIDWVDVILIKK